MQVPTLATLARQFIQRHFKSIEGVILESNYIWSSPPSISPSRKGEVKSLADLSKEEKKKASKVVVSVISNAWWDEESAKFLSSRRKLLGLFQFGSRVWGTAEQRSDWDFLAVCEDVPNGEQAFDYLACDELGVNVSIFTLSDFKEGLEHNVLDLMPPLFVDECFVWLNELGEDQPQLNLIYEALHESLLRELERTHNRAYQMRTVDYYKAKKFLLHSLRYISFATQLLLHGKIVSFSEVNFFWEEVKRVSFEDWLLFVTERYFPLYKAAFNKYKELLVQKVAEKPNPDWRSKVPLFGPEPSGRAKKWRRQRAAPSGPSRGGYRVIRHTLPWDIPEEHGLDLESKKISEETSDPGYYDKFDHEDAYRLVKDERNLWTSFFYMQGHHIRTTLKMVCIDAVISKLMQTCVLNHLRDAKERAAQKAKEEQQEKDEGKAEKEEEEKKAEQFRKNDWLKPYAALPNDLKGLLHSELEKREMLLPELAKIFETSKEDYKEGDEGTASTRH